MAVLAAIHGEPADFLVVVTTCRCGDAPGAGDGARAVADLQAGGAVGEFGPILLMAVPPTSRVFHSRPGATPRLREEVGRRARSGCDFTLMVPPERHPDLPTGRRRTRWSWS